MRELTVNEIAQLEERGCRAEDWSDILVEEGFAPSQMENVLLYGHVEVGSLNGSVEMEEGFRRRCCLRNAVLRNVTVGDDCLIENVRGYISNYQIGDRCYIANVGVMTSQEGSTFGNGNTISDGGTIVKDGTDITKLGPSKRGMGIVFQNYALFENMTVLQNVEYALKIRKENKSAAARKQVRERALAMIEQMGLSEHADKLPSMLSGGQQQRVAIARTMVLNPDIILFDEPMSALDVETRLSLRAELKRIQKEFGTTMIYITHDQEEAFAMSDRIMIMREANVVQLDTPENIIDHPADDYVRSFVLRNLQIKIDSLMKCVRS